ncbi:hypothetical protein AKJ56_00250 [candidate division MSBL1 archaeon SCGC-AAA382N08]|uniref:4Fe-4S ferredoxin-type domain-containing protein n=1 Tax=candidate division MSBL1 archaeon SCGC-AAA382N08 TaxID=1698285 RepID=A0A133VQV2_9EURY|nr:hypothetical protein AKJ56_00250 [candidate division MSBL1 archaeon SCGC-AAA382N08]
MEVASISCADYEINKLKRKMENSLSLIGGVEDFVDSSDTVLLKPNLLSPKPPDSGIITNPNVVKSAIEIFQGRAAEVLVGESSGGVSGEFDSSLTDRGFQESGLEEVCSETEAYLINFDRIECELISVSQGVGEDIPVPKPVLDADIVVSLPKLKTHAFTLFTGAIKNLYGCIPGMKKREYHKLYPNPKRFAEVIVDILQIIKPDLSIMDGVEGLHGNGPGEKGKKFHMGVVMASSDLVALDTVAAGYLGFGDEDIPISKIAGDRDLGVNNSDKIEILGDFDEPDEEFELPSGSFLRILPNWILEPISASLKAKPKINSDNCALCEICLESCPQDAIYSDSGTARINIDDCIKCLCCHELCPKGAVEIEENPVFRFFSDLVS